MAPIQACHPVDLEPVCPAVSTPGLEMHPFSSQTGLLVKVHPPKQPGNSQPAHVPCDIVLVIDISRSMSNSAEPPRTLTLDENDRLGVVTFSAQAKTLEDLKPMTSANKKKTNESIERMEPQTSTNLWDGICEGLGLFDKASPSSGRRVPALMVLTDGKPNHIPPAQGFVPKLRSYEPLPATIHTFGFGYDLESGLLKSIAEVGRGNYSFIPDAGMIGTAFVHAVANLQSTFANNAILQLTYPRKVTLRETIGQSVIRQDPVFLDMDRTQMTIDLGNLQYGQSRDIYLQYDKIVNVSPIVQAVLKYQHFTPITLQVTTQANLLNPSTTLRQSVIAYHVSRSAIIAFLSSLFFIRLDSGYEVLDRDMDSRPFATELQQLIATLPAKQGEFDSDPACRSLVEDLCGASPNGQISLALSDSKHFKRWGPHYLLSLAGAHARQICNSFKDPGPLMYSINSPLFIHCRDRINNAFDDLRPPKPTCTHKPHNSKTTISMKSYNQPSNTCFAGRSTVLLADNTAAASSSHKAGQNHDHGSNDSPPTQGGGRLIRIGRLRAGMRVQTPKGPRTVVAVLKTPVSRAALCMVGGGLLVTPHHPVSLDGGQSWTFPKDVSRRSVPYSGSVYSVLLQRDADVDAHAIMVDGVWGVSLGHGLTRAEQVVGGDVRVHRFLGDYDAVVGSLKKLHGSSNFRKDWQRRVRCHFDQPGKKVARRIARRAKAAAVAPRPVDKLRPIVRCPTVKYNRRTRLGRGFSLAELKAAGIPKLQAPTIGISVDHRRANLSEEGLAANVERLKAYKARLIVFPRKSNKPKSEDSSKEDQTAETTSSIRSAFGVEEAIAPGFSEIKKSDLPKAVEGGAYRALRNARSQARLVGVREKRIKDREAEEKAKK
ncbi:ribosomal protein L13e-domain-containing protein [Bombardia bombarda]|uniref:60S ribosomal protein L13 n=1 Tax=Bombardia bombarda TaxID=252184 RepID=A0AA39WHQ2_9PEZI|nr:ribosomal protein L13e-domain-containing protein [Bombardia bombarda]